MSTPPIKSRSLNLYRGEPQHDVFSSMASVFPTNVLSPSSSPFQFAEGAKISLPTHYQFEEEQKSSTAFIKNTDTSALLVLKDGKVTFEQYWLTGGRDVNWISWSVAKSFIATLVGIAIEEGLIESIEAPITRYIKSLEGSAYDGVSIKHVLQMSSGARWSEDYSDDDSDVLKLAAVMSGESTLEQFVCQHSKRNKTWYDLSVQFCRHTGAGTITGRGYWAVDYKLYAK
ncbi:MAG: CubicO group peptidase (beta-lactamase class C family) [Flavobacterium sp.]|jgi:CubicO group peptidase (beta-lactamase class C family)